MNYERKKKFIVNVLFFALIIGLIYICSKFLTGYLMPLIVGLVVLLIIQRPVRFLSEKTPLPRTFWSIVLVIFSFSAIVSLAVLAGYQLYNVVLRFSQKLPDYIPVLVNFSNNMGDLLSPVFDMVPDELVNTVNTLPETLIKSLTEKLTGWLSGFATSMISSVPAMLITFVVSIVASCYITKDYDILKAFIKRNTPKKVMPTVLSVKELFKSNIIKVAKGYLIIMCITFLELTAGLLLLRVNFAVPLAALIALIDIIPVLGVGTVLLPWALIQLISGNYFMAIGLLVLYLIITVARNIIEPKIISKQVGLNPLVTLLAMYCGLRLFGLVGMIGLPVAIIILSALYSEGKLRPFGETIEEITE